MGFKVPQDMKHVAIIMDGNGRWAQSRRRPRVWGHVRGSFVLSDIVEKADQIGLKSLTVYAFSTENWKRPTSEIKVLFTLLKKFVTRERSRILRNNIRFKVMGDLGDIPEHTRKLVCELEKDSANNKGLHFNVAFSYGGRDEVVRAVNKFMVENPDRLISEKDLPQYLYLPEEGDVDVLLRTGGDLRISNFLLWQSAYAELFFTNTKWPDFTTDEFEQILRSVATRERRFGAIKETCTEASLPSEMISTESLHQ
jgi:undecaprenyl diphosphate synthase